MAIKTASVLLDAVTSFTAGTAKALTSIGSSLTENKTFWNGTDLRTRYEANFGSKPPTKKSDAPNGYSQQRNSVFLKFPKVLANGNTTVNTVQVIVSTDVETSAAEKTTYLNATAQFCADSDFSSFWTSGSLD